MKLFSGVSGGWMGFTGNKTKPVNKQMFYRNLWVNSKIVSFKIAIKLNVFCIILHYINKTPTPKGSMRLVCATIGWSTQCQSLLYSWSSSGCKGDREFRIYNRLSLFILLGVSKTVGSSNDKERSHKQYIFVMKINRFVSNLYSM